MGKSVSYSTIDGGDCKPADTTDGKIIYPCGLIANSLFNGMFVCMFVCVPSKRRDD